MSTLSVTEMGQIVSAQWQRGKRHTIEKLRVTRARGGKSRDRARILFVRVLSRLLLLLIETLLEEGKFSKFDVSC